MEVVLPRKLLSLGFGNSVVARRVLAIVNPASSPMKRLREEAREARRLVDATQGRRTRSIIITDSGPCDPKRHPDRDHGPAL